MLAVAAAMVFILACTPVAADDIGLSCSPLNTSSAIVHLKVDNPGTANYYRLKTKSKAECWSVPTSRETVIISPTDYLSVEPCTPVSAHDTHCSLPLLITITDRDRLRGTLVMPNVSAPFCSNDTSLPCLDTKLTCKSLPAAEVPVYPFSHFEATCTRCPVGDGSRVCSGRGACLGSSHSLNGTCACYAGWAGPVCNLVASPSATASATPSVSPSATVTPSATPSHSSTPSITPTPSCTASVSATPTPTPSSTSNTTHSSTPSLSPSPSITPSPSVTPSITPSSSSSPSPSAAPPHRHGMPTGVIAASVSVCAVVLVGAGGVFCWRRRRQQRTSYKGQPAPTAAGAGVTSPLLSAGHVLETSPVKAKFVIDFHLLRIGHEVARGAGGVVYAGSYLGQHVALKEVFCGSGAQPIDKTLLKEVTLLGNLHHPYIVRMFGVSYRAPNMYIVTELCRRSMFDVLVGGGEEPSMPQRVRWALQVGYGMLFLHNHNIIHRDLKPGNILLDHLDNAKICDFGLARVSHSAAMTGFLGTPQYMAPETMSSRQVRYTNRVDTYSFGIVLYELVMWRLAYPEMYAMSGGGVSTAEGGSSDGQAPMGVFALRDKVLAGYRPEFPAAGTAGGDVPGVQELGALARQCWHEDPTQRPAFEDVVQAMEAVARALQLALPRQ